MLFDSFVASDHRQGVNVKSHWLTGSVSLSAISHPGHWTLGWVTVSALRVPGTSVATVPVGTLPATCCVVGRGVISVMFLWVIHWWGLLCFVLFFVLFLHYIHVVGFVNESPVYFDSLYIIFSSSSSSSSSVSSYKTPKWPLLAKFIKRYYHRPIVHVYNEEIGEMPLFSLCVA